MFALLGTHKWTSLLPWVRQMISYHILKRALEKERMKVKRQDPTLFVQGVVQGMTYAIAIAEDIWATTKYHILNNPTGLKGRKLKARAE